MLWYIVSCMTSSLGSAGRSSSGPGFVSLVRMRVHAAPNEVDHCSFKVDQTVPGSGLELVCGLVQGKASSLSTLCMYCVNRVCRYRNQMFVCLCMYRKALSLLLLLKHPSVGRFQSKHFDFVLQYKNRCN